MSLLFVSLMGVPLFLSPLWTYLRFQEAYFLERTTVAMDNASIRLGQSFKEALRVLERGRLEILALEALHHVSHACANAPVPFSPACRVEDSRIELQIQTKRLAILSEARAAWAKGNTLASLQGQRLKSSIRWARAQDVPVRSRICSVCRKPAEWVPVFPWEAVVEAKVRGRKLQNRVKAMDSLPSPSYEVLAELGNE